MPPSFADRLRATLALTLGSDAVELPGGSIERIDVDVQPYGFEAEVSFVVSSEQEEDAVFTSFVTRDLVKATLTLANHEAAADDEDGAPLVLTGFVTEKRVVEVISDALTANPINRRRYFLRFADPAQVFWKQHFPVELHIETSLSELFAMHLAAGMKLTCDWSLLDDKRDLLCVPLAADRGVSFYDFVMWLVHDGHGVLELDAKSVQYGVRKAKSRGKRTVTPGPEDLEEVRVLPPEPPRHTTHVLNPFTSLAGDVPVPSAQAVVGVRRDVFAYEAIATRVASRVRIESARLAPPEHLVEITYKRVPTQLPIPGDAASFGDELSAKLYPHGRKYRVVSTHLRAFPAPDREAELDDESAFYTLDLTARLELEADPTPRLPPFRRPIYPMRVEGRVLSASGGDGDRTWFAVENPASSIVYVGCEIPLWNKKIVAPFTPNRMPGHFFFPAYKHQRVLVALDLEDAKIEAFLDWADNAKLAKDTQGNKLVMGYGDANGTIVQHVYEDEKPVLTVRRRLGGDQETMTLTEGVIRIEVKEDPLVPKIEPKFDVLAQVAAAKERVSSSVKGSIGQVSGKFEASMGGVTGALETASADVEAGLASAEATLVGKIEMVEAELNAQAASSAAAVQALATKVPEAKGAIMTALMG